MKESIENINEELLIEDEKLTSFLKGKMSKEEESVFIQELKANPKLKAKAIAVARLVKGMKEVRQDFDKELKKELISAQKEEIKEIAKNTINPKKKTIIPFTKSVKWISLAASIALIMWLGYGYYDYKKTTGLGDEFAGAFETSLITRGGNSSSEVEKKLQILFDNVNANNELDNTIHELSLYWELSNMETYNDYSDYSNEIGWNLAIGHLKNNDKNKARNVLERIKMTSEIGTALHKKVCKLLEKL